MTVVKHEPGEATAKLRAALKTLQGVTGKVGWPESAKYADGTPVAYVAAIQEYGYDPKHIPPRLGFRATLPSLQPELQRVAGVYAKRMLADKAGPIDAMDAIGGTAQGLLFKHISNVTSPPLAFATQAARAYRRGIPPDELTATGAKPLNDTGLLIATLTHQTEVEGSEAIEAPK
jgi:hypothetical protein